MSVDKKRSIILVSVLSILCIALIAFLVVDRLKANGTIASGEAKQIMQNFNKYYTSSKRTVIFYASSTCGWCSLQTPILETIAEDYDMDYLYIDAAKLGKKQKEEIAEKLNIEAVTPTTVIVENSEVIDVTEGFTPSDEYVEFFASNNVIPENAVYSKEKNLTEINYSQYEGFISDGGTHIIMLSQTTCSHCIAVKPTLNSIAAEYNLTINFLEINVLGQADYTKFKDNLNAIEYNEPKFVENGSFGTPLVLIIKNGKVSSFISGERTKSQYVREFKKAGFISE